jgi:hypothetical protein
MVVASSLLRNVPLNIYCTVHAVLVAIPRNVVRALAKATAGEFDERKGDIRLDQAKGSEREGVLTVLIGRASYNSRPSPEVGITGINWISKKLEEGDVLDRWSKMFRSQSSCPAGK